MTHRAFAERLEQAAARVPEMSLADLRVLLLNAALRLKNMSGLALEAEVEKALDLLAAQLKLPRQDVLAGHAVNQAAGHQHVDQRGVGDGEDREEWKDLVDREVR